LEAVMHKRLIMLLGVFLGSHVPTGAQTPSPQIVPAHVRVAPIVTMVRTVPGPFPFPSFPLSEGPGKSAAHFSYLFVGAHEHDQSLESLSHMREAKTLFLTQSSLPLVQLWGGRLRLDGFKSNLNMQNMQLGPAAAGGLLDYRPQRQGYPAGPRSFGFYGANLSFHFGRDSRTRPPTQVWRRMTRFVGAVLN
jgi:hypothetical protein